MLKPLIITDESVVLRSDTDGMKFIPKENPMFAKLVLALNKHQFDKLEELVDIATKIKKATNGRFYVKDGLVFIDGETLPEALSKRLLAFADADLPCETLLVFWENLKQNPSERSKEQLYGFLEHNGIPLTSDGCFVAYKRVNKKGDGTLVDNRTQTFDNTPGQVVSMPREEVDDNPNQTCSTGLHVAAYNYATGYCGDTLIEVKVNPRDVVAVPTDYNNKKMRVCEYTVIRECEQEITRPMYDPPDDDEDYDDVDDDYGTDEEIDDAENDEQDVLTTKVVKPDNRGRVCIPVEIMCKMRYGKAGDAVDVKVSNNMLIISNMATYSDYDADYRVDSYGNVRVSKCLLEKAGIANQKTYILEYSPNRDEIAIS